MGESGLNRQTGVVPSGEDEIGLIAQSFALAPTPLFITINSEICYCNRELERLLHCSAVEVIGTRVADLFLDLGEYRRRADWASNNMLRQGQYDYEALFKRPDGSLFWGRVSGRTLSPRRPLATAVWSINELDSRPNGQVPLSPRERDVARYVAEGLSNKQAAARLGISHRTVEMHRARLMRKLGAKNCSSLLAALERMGGD